MGGGNNECAYPSKQEVVGWFVFHRDVTKSCSANREYRLSENKKKKKKKKKKRKKKKGFFNVVAVKEEGPKHIGRGKLVFSECAHAHVANMAAAPQCNALQRAT